MVDAAERSRLRVLFVDRDSYLKTVAMAVARAMMKLISTTTSITMLDNKFTQHRSSGAFNFSKKDKGEKDNRKEEDGEPIRNENQHEACWGIPPLHQNLNTTIAFRTAVWHSDND